MDRARLRRTGLFPLEPDEFALKTATYVMFAPCPFCGSQTGPVMDYCNEAPEFSDRPIYKSVIECSYSRCGASIRYNGYTRDEARTKAIERWQDRRPASDRETARSRRREEGAV